MIKVATDEIVRFGQALAILITDPKNALKRSAYGKITTKDDISALEIYLCSAIVIIASSTLLIAYGELSLFRAAGMAVYMMTRIGYVCVLMYISYYIFNKFNKKIAYEHVQIFLISTAVWSMPLLALSLIMAVNQEINLQYMCESIYNNVKNTKRVNLNPIEALGLISFSTAGYIYFFIYAYSLSYTFKKTFIPFAASLLVLYPLLRPYIVEPMAKLICAVP